MVDIHIQTQAPTAMGKSVLKATALFDKPLQPWDWITCLFGLAKYGWIVSLIGIPQIGGISNTMGD